MKQLHRESMLKVLLLLLAFFPFKSEGQKKIVGYLPNSVDVHSFSRAFDFSKITHLNIAFENPDEQGNLSYNNSNDILIKSAKAKKVKVLVSIAGGGVSVNPEKIALYHDLISDSKRAGFVKKISDYLGQHSLDGLDVDLEGDAINADYRKFIKDLSTALKPKGKLLTAALSHINGGDRVPEETFQYFDFINIMAYDSTGPWRPDNPGQHSSFAFAEANMNFWLEKGLPKEKAILGVPFYGYGFGESLNEGMAYSEIIKTFPGAEDLDQVGNIIYYNGIPTIKAKAQLALDQEYGGIMIWQIAQDSIGDKSLLDAINEVLKKSISKNKSRK